jgi:pilus assembly protein CpaB
MAATATTVNTGARPGDRRVLFLAIFLGVIAAVLTLAYIRSQGVQSVAVVPTTSVVVAARELQSGERITPNMVEVRTLQTTAVGTEVYGKAEEVVGRTIRYPVAKGEPISAVRLIDPPRVQSLSFQIPQGMRGFTIPINITRSPAALLVPGDFVDILASVPVGTIGQTGGEDDRAVITVLQNIQVLSVARQTVPGGVPYDQSVRGAQPKEANVQYLTLAVSPEEAQQLTVAMDLSRNLTVSMRAFGDTEKRDLPPARDLGARR